MNKAIKLTSSLRNAAFTVPKFIQPAAKLFLYTRMAALISYLTPHFFSWLSPTSSFFDYEILSIVA